MIAIHCCTDCAPRNGFCRNRNCYCHKEKPIEGWQRDVWKWATAELPGTHSDRFAALFDVIRQLLTDEREKAYQEGHDDTYVTKDFCNSEEGAKSALQELREEVKKRKETLVVDNWQDGKAKVCNPRCHDSGKEDALSKVLTLIDARITNNENGDVVK